MPSRVVLPIHGEDHRPVGFNGPDDPGGPDPIPWEPPEAGSSEPVEVAVYRSTTNWVDTPTGIGLVDPLDFTLLGGQYDLGTPTFDVNGDSNPIIQKAGAYEIDFVITDPPAGDGTQFVSVQTRIQMIDGPAPFGWYNAGSGESRYNLLVVPGDTLPDDREECPLWSDKLFFSDDDFPDTAEFAFKAIAFLDGVQTADSAPTVYVMFTRFGSVWA